MITTASSSITQALQKLRNRTLHMISSRLWFFGGYGPADPFIACQWG